MERHLRPYQEKHCSETTLLFLKLSDFRVHTKASKCYCQTGWVRWKVDKNLDLPNSALTFSKSIETRNYVNFHNRPQGRGKQRGRVILLFTQHPN